MEDLNRKKQKEFYNERWACAQHIKGLKLRRCIAILNEIANLKMTQPQIIELGCGTGWLTNILNEIGPSVGLDLSDAAINAASAKYPTSRYLAVDIMNMKADQFINKFDLVISHEVIEHIEDQEQYLKIASELLKVGGYLILTMPNKNTSKAMGYSPATLQPIEKWLSVRELKKKTKPYFKICRISTINPGYGSKGMYKFIANYYLRKGLEKLGVLYIYDALMLKLHFGLQILLVAQKTQ